jgi:polyisoprenoid-binding protein YceI
MQLSAPRSALLSAVLLTAPVTLVTALVTALVTTGCKDPTTGTPKALTGAPAPSSTGGAAGTVYSVTPTNSQIHWTGSKVTGSHDGSFAAFSGSITLVAGAIDKSRVTVDIDTPSIATVPENLVKHLKSADFFNIEQFPKASFTSTSIGSQGKDTYIVTGNLTLHGVTKSITFPATIKIEGDFIVVDAEFSLNRKEFSINYPGKIDDAIRDDVLIKLSLHATKT